MNSRESSKISLTRELTSDEIEVVSGGADCESGSMCFPYSARDIDNTIVYIVNAAINWLVS